MSLQHLGGGLIITAATLFLVSRVMRSAGRSDDVLLIASAVSLGLALLVLLVARSRATRP